MINEILADGEDIMIHVSFSSVRDFGGFPNPTNFCEAMTGVAKSEQTLTIPAFTYSFVSSKRGTIPFNRDSSPTVTGALSEAFRNFPGVFRTSSPSHSFSVWGEGAGIVSSNNPVSPLGKTSVCDLLFKRGEFKVVMIGCGFESLTLLHYFESLSALPYINSNCWSYMGIEPVSLSVDGTYPVIELPGCSKGFRKFEDYLLDSNELKSLSNRFKFYLIDPYSLFHKFSEFTADAPLALLCEDGCPACDARKVREFKKFNHGEINVEKITVSGDSIIYAN